MVSCKTSDGILKSDAPVSSKDYPYIDSFHKGMQLKVQGRNDEAIVELEKCLLLRQDDDAVYYALSKLELDRGNLEASATYIQKAHEIDEDNIWYVEELAYMYFENQEYEKASQSFENLVKAEPRNIDWQYAYSEALMQSGKSKEALEVFKTMEAQVGKHPHFALQRYNVFMQSGNKTAAEEELLKAKKEFPQDPSIIGTLVDFYYQTEQVAKAEQFLIELVEADPQNGRAQLALADMYQRRNEMDKAYNALKMAIESPELDIDTKMGVLINIQEQSTIIPVELFPIVEAFTAMYPNSAKAHSILGDYKIRDEKKEEALLAYQKALELDKSLFPIWNQVLILQYEANDFEGLYEYSNNCLELFPAASTVYLLKGISANKTGKHKEAADALVVGMEMIVNDNSMKAEFYSQLGEAYFGTGEDDASIKSYKKAIELDYKSTAIKNNFARRLAAMNRELELAKSLSEQITEAFPNESIYLDTRGWILFLEGEYTDAQSWFEKALEADPQSVIAMEHLGDVLAKQNKIAEALEYWIQTRETGVKSDVLEKKIANKKYYVPER